MTGELTFSLLSSLLEVHPYPTVAVELDGTFISWNKAAQEVCSIYKLVDNKESTIFSFLEDETKGKLAEAFSLVRSKGSLEKLTLFFNQPPVQEGSAEIIVSHWRFFGKEGFSLVFQNRSDLDSLNQAFSYSADLLRKPVEKVDKILKEQGVLAAVIQAQEEERRRFAESLHNGVGQLLYGSKMKIRYLQNSLQQNPTLQKHVLELGQFVDEAIKEAKGIAFELLPSILQDFGLKVALKELIRRIVPSHLKVDLQSVDGDKRYAADIEIGVYRIVQELINNVIKHAQASTISILIQEEGNSLYIQVEDDGIGYILNQERTSTQGMGLVIIQDRVRALNGKLQVESNSNRGTTTKIYLPIIPW